jgi:hypothetical protein
MFELDFVGLRHEVEAATRLPEFGTVEQRAKRLRKRDRLAVLAVLLATLAVLTPSGFAALAANGSGPAVIGPDQEEPQPVVSISPSTSPDVAQPLNLDVHTLAITGPDLNHLFAAVDVCSNPAKGKASGSRICSLQVSPLGDSSKSPLVIGQLRRRSDQTLSNVQLTPLSSKSLLLSGVPAGGAPVFVRISTTGGASTVSVPGHSGSLSTGDHVVQLSRHGELFGVRQSDDEIVRIAQQPALAQPTVVSSVAPGKGWWATGVDPGTGELAVAVSRDLGHSWVSRRLGVRPGTGTPVLGSYDGRVAYLFIAIGSEVVEFTTLDGGLTWSRVPASLPPTPGGTVDNPLGTVVRPDGSVLFWTADHNGTVFRESHDGGHSFAATTTPDGPITATGDGYVVVDDLPEVSRDGRTWTAMPAASYIPPS